MKEPLKDIPSSVPNEMSQSQGQPQSHPSDHAAPLHERLPLEMFVAIIHLCVGFSTPVRDLVTLQLVCRSWHDIIVDASFLWGTINAAEGSLAVRKALQMAKDSLIDLDFIQDTSKINQTQFFQLVRGKLNQWRSFVVESREWRSALDDLRTQKPPKLDKLHVTATQHHREEDKEIVLFGGGPTTGLKDVRLAYVPISPAPLRLSGLKSLRLQGMPWVSAVEVIAIITQSPGLEILELGSLKGAVLPTDETSGQLNFASSSPIKLASLIELNLRYMHLSFVSYLVLTVAFPQLRSLRVECGLGENPAVQLGETAGLNRLNPSMNTVASSARICKVTLSGWGYYVIGIGGLDIIVWRTGGFSLDRFLETFTWLSGHLKQSLHNLPLHLDLDNHDPEPSCLEWFTRRTNVITLSLYSDLFFGSRLGCLIRIISPPISPPPSSSTWLFPKVEVLRTNCVGIVENIKIVDMIGRRQSASRGSFGAGVNEALPKRLKRGLASLWWDRKSSARYGVYVTSGAGRSRSGRVLGREEVDRNLTQNIQLSLQSDLGPFVDRRDVDETKFSVYVGLKRRSGIGRVAVEGPAVWFQLQPTQFRPRHPPPSSNVPFSPHRALPLASCCMNERLKDTPSPVLSEISQRNARPQPHPSDPAAPLHERLPLEIFGAILHLCVGFKTPVRDLTMLQLVCRSWHDIIVDTSFLWGTINAAEGLPAVRKALQMAKDSLIDLTFIQDANRINQTQFFKLARGKLNQWRSLVVESKQWRSALDDLRAQKPPKLDRLHVTNYYLLPEENREFVLFGGDSTPGLKDVRLAYVPISPAPLRLSGLKSLRLEGIPSVSAVEVIAIITESPGLEILHLNFLKGTVPATDATLGQPNYASSSPIELAFLIELKLISLPLPFLFYFLSTVGCMFEENSAVPLGETPLNRLNSIVNSIASGAQMYEVTLSGWRYYEISIGGLRLYVSGSLLPVGRLSSDHFLETFTWLSGHLEQSLHDLPLHLNLEIRDPEPLYWEWFARCTNVTMLTLKSHSSFVPGLENLVRTISGPTPQPHSTSPTWLFPQLEVLSIKFVGKVGNIEIVDMIERRQSASRGSFGTGVNGALPKRLREVWLAYGGITSRRFPLDTEFMSKVVQAAAGADVYWERKKWIGSYEVISEPKHTTFLPKRFGTVLTTKRRRRNKVDVPSLRRAQQTIWYQSPGRGRYSSSVSIPTNAIPTSPPPTTSDCTVLASPSTRALPLASCCMDEAFKDIPSTMPNESSQNHGQSQTRPSDHTAPLHERLPLEIFCHIIHLCVGFKTPVRDLVTLQLVCRSWHDIIADTSFLWGTINAKEGFPAVRKALEMAKDSLIDINFINPGRKIDQTEFFKLAREKIDQWRSLVVESREWESALAGLRSKKPPNLDTLHWVRESYVPSEGEEIVLFGGDPASGLKDVRFANVPINRASLQLSGLKSLRLGWMPSVSATEVITLLTASPGLEILHLVSLKGAVLPTQTTPNQPNLASNSVIELAFLIELKLFWLNLPFLSHLLSTLTLPQLHSLHMGCDLDKNTAFQLGETVGMNRLDSSLNLVASGARMYEVTLSSEGSYAFSIGGLNVRIPCKRNGDTLALDTSLQLPLGHFLKTFTWLSDHLEQSLHELPLHLILRDSDPESSFLEWFTSHTNVTTLTLDRDDLGILLKLAKPRSPPPSPPNWLFPQVEVLHINFASGGRDLGLVAGMVHARHAASRRSSAGGANRTFPKPFGEIRLTCDGVADVPPPPDEVFMSWLVESAEGADVYWGGKKWSTWAQETIWYQSPGCGRCSSSVSIPTNAISTSPPPTIGDCTVLALPSIRALPLVSCCMDEAFKDIPSPVPNESSQSNGQSQTRPPDHAAPLHERLPLEIFCHIIHLCVGFKTPVHDLIRLQLVCRIWHDIIADTSFLWGTINAKEGSPAVRKALEMAQDSLIDINCINPGWKVDQTEFFKLAREKVNQWRSFVVESREWESAALAGLRSKKPPNLDTLHCVMEPYAAYQGEEIVLFGGDPASGLKDVRFANVPITADFKTPGHSHILHA
ncbi:hypothetical protein FRC05_003247 [Tulasnella sp. 425]|nr:hypothetical protein FRC05_003247 [Tulasnella sp. 425]